MGKIKYIAKVREFFKKTPIVTISSLNRIIDKKGNYVYLMLNKMAKHGEIHKVSRGAYSIYDDPIITVFCFKPAYLGLQDALSIHNLWEQETNVIILTTKTIREGIRTILDSKVIVRRINQKYFFGFYYMKHGDFYVPVSDVEKTFIDLVYFNQPIDKELIQNFRKKLDKKKLEKYLMRYDDLIVKKVINLLSIKLK